MADRGRDDVGQRKRDDIQREYENEKERKMEKGERERTLYLVRGY